MKRRCEPTASQRTRCGRVTAAVVIPDKISTLPDPLEVKIKLSFDLVTFNILSVKFMLESIVMFDTLTTPVPPGVNLKSAFDDVPIMLSFDCQNIFIP